MFVHILSEREHAVRAATAIDLVVVAVVEQTSESVRQAPDVSGAMI
jgi:hypothetical protein